MNHETKEEKSALDRGLRRMGSILASPWLVTAYSATEPRLERAWLRRAGLTKDEAALFLDMLCRRGLLDRGARSVVEEVCLARKIAPEAAIRLLMNGEAWPEEEDKNAEKS